MLARRAALAPEQRLILTAHYDTKTDALDHVERAPVDLLALPVIPLMLVGALAAMRAARAPGRSRWLARLGAFAAWSAAVYGVATFIALSAGAFLPARSPGALDDGGSCAVLVRVAEALAARPPPARTDVEVLLLSAEEVGVQGSWAYAAQRFAAPPDLPTFVVNLEGIGASADFAVLGRERFTLRSFAPDARLVALLDERHRVLFGKPLERTRLRRRDRREVLPRARDPRRDARLARAGARADARPALRARLALARWTKPRSTRASRSCSISSARPTPGISEPAGCYRPRR